MGKNKGLRKKLISEEMSKQRLIKKWKSWAKKMKAEIYTLYFAYKDRRLNKLAKIVIFFVVIYALSPVDLIPDFIPVIGYIDDLILLPIGILIARKLVPDYILSDARKKTELLEEQTNSWYGGVLVIIVWFLVLFSLYILIQK